MTVHFVTGDNWFATASPHLGDTSPWDLFCISLLYLPSHHKGGHRIGCWCRWSLLQNWPAQYRGRILDCAFCLRFIINRPTCSGQLEEELLGILFTSSLVTVDKLQVCHCVEFVWLWLASCVVMHPALTFLPINDGYTSRISQWISLREYVYQSGPGSLWNGIVLQ